MIKRYIKAIREKKQKKLFCKKACVDSENLVLFANASCQNTGAQSNVNIGTHCTFGCLFQALCGGKINVGNNVYIGPNTVLQSKESITIGNAVIIANNVLIVDNNNHPVDPESRLQMSACDDFLHDELWSWKYAESKPIVIEDNVWVGRDSRIMKGVTIGKGSIVALGAIVTKDVPPYTIVAGNPARVVKNIQSGSSINEEN